MDTNYYRMVLWFVRVSRILSLSNIEGIRNKKKRKEKQKWYKKLAEKWIANHKGDGWKRARTDRCRWVSREESMKNIVVLRFLLQWCLGFIPCDEYYRMNSTIRTIFDNFRSWNSNPIFCISIDSVQFRFFFYFFPFFFSFEYFQRKLFSLVFSSSSFFQFFHNFYDCKFRSILFSRLHIFFFNIVLIKFSLSLSFFFSLDVLIEFTIKNERTIVNNFCL